MRPNIFLAALIALLAAVLSASPSFAHGGKQHASHIASSEGACCSGHCCATGGLSLAPLQLTPVFASARVAIASDWPPAEAAADGHLRPPCR
jgi:hypothetical protein